MHKELEYFCQVLLAHCIPLWYDKKVRRYSLQIIEKVKELRRNGKTYGEIKLALNKKIPKSTLSAWCKNIPLPKNYKERISKLNTNNLKKARLVASKVNRTKREEFFQIIKKQNSPIAKKIFSQDIAKIALAMLCLGEASKYNPKTHASFSLGNSNPKIIIMFLKLLKRCFKFDVQKVRCTVQCRADQDINKLENYWQKTTGIPRKLFYKSRIDPRTKGKPTLKSDYKGVLRVDYFDRKVQLELELLADLVYNALH